MRSTARMMILLSLLALSTRAFASEAETSARVSRGIGMPDQADAAARYEGDFGFARTDTRTGGVNLARGVAVGVDEDGLSLSLSHAVSGKHGPAIATNFSMSVGRDGRVSRGIGRTFADGTLYRSAGASGGTSTRGHAHAGATGRTDPFGRVVSRTDVRSDRERGRIRRGSDPVGRVVPASTPGVVRRGESSRSRTVIERRVAKRVVKRISRVPR